MTDESTSNRDVDSAVVLRAIAELNRQADGGSHHLYIDIDPDARDLLIEVDGVIDLALLVRAIRPIQP